MPCAERAEVGGTHLRATEPPDAGTDPPAPPSLRGNPHGDPLITGFWPEGNSSPIRGLGVVVQARPRAGRRSLWTSRSQAPKLSPPGKGPCPVGLGETAPFCAWANAGLCAFPAPRENLGSGDRPRKAGRVIPGLRPAETKAQGQERLGVCVSGWGVPCSRTLNSQRGGGGRGGLSTSWPGGQEPRESRSGPRAHGSSRAGRPVICGGGAGGPGTARAQL